MDLASETCDSAPAADMGIGLRAGGPYHRGHCLREPSDRRVNRPSSTGIVLDFKPLRPLVPSRRRDKIPFWKSKSLEAMSDAEWESLCDGCGRCCLNKIEDTETGEIFLTRVACKLLDIQTCRCSDYEHRQKKVPDCIRIDVEQVRTLSWLPKTCGYRAVEEGRDLAWWHPLVSGDPDTVHAAGISIRTLAKSERHVKAENIRRYLIDGYPKPIPRSKAKT